MQSTNKPAPYLIPFAQNDSAKVEIPATTSDPTRFSQSLGSPPLTGMPPEAGGVPPQLEDFNGALNQPARVAWWMLGGNRFGFDATWANDPLIGGYARGAMLPAALGSDSVGMGDWLNNTENNTANPDTNGTGWVPGYAYGLTSVAITGGTVTLTPAQAHKRVLYLTGTLTSNAVVVVPGWIYDWTVHNFTGGAFTVTVKNAATPGVIIPQNGAPTPVRCDGTACTLWSPNVAPAVSGTQAMRLDQAVGRLINTQYFEANGTYVPTPGTRQIIVEIVGGGGGGAGNPATTATQSVAAGGGGGGTYLKFLLAVPTGPTAITIGAGGAPGPAVLDSVGGAGSPSSFGSLATVNGGSGGSALYANTTTITLLGPGGQGGTVSAAPGVSGIVRSQGARGGFGLLIGSGATFQAIGGAGGASLLGVMGRLEDVIVTGNNAGAGGHGSSAGYSTAARAGGRGGGGLCIVWEYS